MVSVATGPPALNHILVVDDDAEWRTLLNDYLSELGYRVSEAMDGAALRRIISADDVDLVLLDLRLPGEDGFTLTTYLRQVSKAGIIIVTGAGQGVDEVVGLELGADDYVAKPCDLRQLAARIRAVLRRTGTSPQADENEDRDRLVEFDGWLLNPPRRTLTSPAGAEVSLTTAEFDLLTILASRSGRPLSRDQLLELLHGREWSPYDRSIDNLISRLRQKLSDAAGTTELIKSVRGIGYVFTGTPTRK